jgi:hypothetical protein
MPGNGPAVFIAGTTTKMLTSRAASSSIDPQWFFVFTGLQVGENQFFSFRANVKISIFIINKVGFVKNIYFLAPLLGLIFAIRDIGIDLSLF